MLGLEESVSITIRGATVMQDRGMGKGSCSRCCEGPLKQNRTVAVNCGASHIALRDSSA